MVMQKLDRAGQPLVRAKVAQRLLAAQRGRNQQVEQLGPHVAQLHVDHILRDGDPAFAQRGQMRARQVFRGRFHEDTQRATWNAARHGAHRNRRHQERMERAHRQGDPRIEMRGEQLDQLLGPHIGRPTLRERPRHATKQNDMSLHWACAFPVWDVQL